MAPRQELTMTLGYDADNPQFNKIKKHFDQPKLEELQTALKKLEKLFSKILFCKIEEGPGGHRKPAWIITKGQKLNFFHRFIANIFLFLADIVYMLLLVFIAAIPWLLFGEQTESILLKSIS